MKTIRRIAFGALGLVFFVEAARSFQQAGLTQAAVFPAAMGALLAVMAIWGKSG
ncbi:MAG: hypothetical protein HY234_02500 [Acidobacteria bacterium]|nr:hypothetical protein [Acidobacteriota bacterium]MBI3661905.1 hypothetical protein [Acidobacteriota bacterium]